MGVGAEVDGLEVAHRGKGEEHHDVGGGEGGAGEVGGGGEAGVDEGEGAVEAGAHRLQHRVAGREVEAV